MFDDDRDGFLSQHELGLALRKLGKDISEADLTNVLQRVRHPSFVGSGRVSTDHFGRILEYISSLGPKATVDISDATVAEALRAFDPTGSGLNMDFLLAMLEQHNGPDKLTKQVR